MFQRRSDICKNKETGGLQLGAALVRQLVGNQPVKELKQMASNVDAEAPPVVENNIFDYFEFPLFELFLKGLMCRHT